MNKSCIFCDERANSKEDVWPKWVIKLLMKSPDERVPMKTRRYKEAPREWMTIDSALKVRNVCRDCNGGWMSRLENEVKPILTPMILGSSVTLSASQQERTATWLTKCAMMFCSMDKGEVYYDQLDQHHFKKVVTPFAHTYVWLGHYLMSGVRSSAEHRTLRTQLSSGHFARMHVLTMSIGQLVLQIVSVKNLEHDDLDRKMEFQTIGPKLSDGLVQVLPVSLQGVSWPPPVSFNDTDRHLRFLAFRFGGDKT